MHKHGWFVQEIVAQTQGFVCKKPVLLIEFRVADAGVVNGLQLLNEHGLGVLNVTESNGALAEIALVDLVIDDTVDKLADALLGVVG